MALLAANLRSLSPSPMRNRNKGTVATNTNNANSSSSSRGASSPSPSIKSTILYPQTPPPPPTLPPSGTKDMKKSSSSPDLSNSTPLSSSSSSNNKSVKKTIMGKKLISIRKRMSRKSFTGSSNNASGSSNASGGVDDVDTTTEEGGSESNENNNSSSRMTTTPTQLLHNAGNNSSSMNGTPPRKLNIRIETTSSNNNNNNDNNKQTIDSSGSRRGRTPKSTKHDQHTTTAVTTPSSQQVINAAHSTSTTASYTTTTQHSTTPRIASPSTFQQQQQQQQQQQSTTIFQFISDDNFTRRVNSYDGQTITCTDSNKPTYEVGNYLGGGVAGVVYEGKRLRPKVEYPPVRIRGGGAFYPNSGGGGGGGGIDVVDFDDYNNNNGGNNNMNIVQPQQSSYPTTTPAAPIAMRMSSSSLSSIRRNRSGGAAAGPNDTAETGTGLFADVYRAVNPQYQLYYQQQLQQQQMYSRNNNNNNQRYPSGTLPRGGFPPMGTPRMTNRNNNHNEVGGGGGCTTFLFGNCGQIAACGNDMNSVDDRAYNNANTANTTNNNTLNISTATNDIRMSTPNKEINNNNNNEEGTTKTTTTERRYQAVDISSIEVPAAFSSMEITPTSANSANNNNNNNNSNNAGINNIVVVDDVDAPNRSKREANALSRNAPQAAALASKMMMSDATNNGVKNKHSSNNNTVVQSSNNNTMVPTSSSSSFMGHNNSGGSSINQTHLIEDMSETVAIKILNPVGFRLLDPETLHKAIIVKEGKLPTVNPTDGTFVLKEEHVWWLVNPNSRNLRSLLRKNTALSTMVPSRSHHREGDDNASDESSLKQHQQQQQQQSLTLGGGNVDRGSSERGLRLSLVATYVDPVTKSLKELPLPKCVEIWGHPPFAATDEEFEAMMEVLLRLNAGYGGSGGGGGSSSSKSRKNNYGRSPSNLSQASSPTNNKGFDNKKNDPLASRRSGSTVYCPALSAYIAVPAIPPKYLRWLKQRQLATKEVRNMLRIGRHTNVVHLYEVLEMVQDSKSTMFLILELVRGGELFDLISSNSSSSKRKNERAGHNNDGDKNAPELHEVTMRKFFRELASGINFIHSCGVAHRDLKPENLLIHTKPATKNALVAEEEKTLKIADFGLSAAFPLYPNPGSLLHNISRGDSNNRWDGNSVWDGSLSSRKSTRSSSGLPLSPQSNSSPSNNKSGISPLLARVGTTAMSMLTCGSMTNVCIDESGDVNDLVDDGMTTVDLRRMTSVVGSPHYVAPEIISQADKGKDGEGGGGGGGGEQSPQDRKSRHAARQGYDGTKADVWSAGVILYAMLFRSLPFGEDLLRCPRYQAFQKWYNEARQIPPPLPGKRNRRAFAECALDPFYDEFDEEEMLGPHWFFPSEITAPGRDLIIAMLNPNPNDRLTIEMVLQHPWLQAMDNGFVVGESEAASAMMTGFCISGT